MLTVVVVVTHLGLVVGRRNFGGFNGLFTESHVLLGVRGAGDGGINGELVEGLVGLVLGSRG